MDAISLLVVSFGGVFVVAAAMIRWMQGGDQARQERVARLAAMGLRAESDRSAVLTTGPEVRFEEVSLGRQPALRVSVACDTGGLGLARPPNGDGRRGVGPGLTFDDQFDIGPGDPLRALVTLTEATRRELVRVAGPARDGVQVHDGRLTLTLLGRGLEGLETGPLVERLEALKLLLARPGDTLIPEALTIAATDPDPSRRAAALDLLAEHAPVATREVALRACDSDDPGEVRAAWLVRAALGEDASGYLGVLELPKLHRLERMRAWPTIQGVLPHVFAGDTELALEGFRLVDVGRLTPPGSAVAALALHLNELVAVAALRLLLQHRLPELEPAAIAALRVGDTRVDVAIEVLVAEGTTHAVPALRELARGFRVGTRAERAEAAIEAIQGRVAHGGTGHLSVHDAGGELTLAGGGEVAVVERDPDTARARM